MIKLVIFDMDGLLIDSETVYAKGWKFGFNSLGLDLSMETIEKMAGQSTVQNTNDVIEIVKSREIAMQIRSIREEYYFSMLQNSKVLTMPFAKELIKILKYNNYKIAVASSSCRKRVLNTLKANNILDKFDSIVCGDDVANEKPMPDVYLKTLENLKINANEAIALEDSITGLRSAMNAKIKVALVNKKPLKDDFDKKYFLGYYSNLEEAYNILFKK